MTREFPLKVAAGKLDPATLALVDELLAQPGPRRPGRGAGDPRTDRAGPRISSDADPAMKVRSHLGRETPTVRAAAHDRTAGVPGALGRATGP